MRASSKIQQEQEAYGLRSNPEYLRHFDRYCDNYATRPPCRNVPTKNMLKALRMGPWHNTAEEWARLHATEIALATRQN